MENSPSSKPRESLLEQMRTCGCIVVPLVITVAAGAIGTALERALRQPVAKATKPATDSKDKWKVTTEKVAETTLTQAAVRKMLEDLGYDVAAAEKLLAMGGGGKSVHICAGGKESKEQLWGMFFFPEKYEAFNSKTTERFSVELERLTDDEEPSLVLVMLQTETFSFGNKERVLDQTKCVVKPGNPPSQRKDLFPPPTGEGVSYRILDAKVQQALLKAMEKIPPKPKEEPQGKPFRFGDGLEQKLIPKAP